MLDTIRHFRKASGLPPNVRKSLADPLPLDLFHQSPSQRTLTYWILQRPENRTIEHEKIITQITSEQPKLGLSIDLAHSFASIVGQ